MILTFFGLSPKFKPLIHSQIFELIYYGKGGFNWSDIYSMPVWLRNFYYKKLETAIKEKNKAEEDATKKAKSSSAPKVKAPPVVKKR